MNQPKVSVLMGIYNCEDTLAEAIDSIVAQTYPNWELIMCDDGSSDGTYALAEQYVRTHPDKMILLRNETNKKLSYTLNRCLEAASGELIARMDGDDISAPDRFARQVEFLETHPDIQMVGTSMQAFDEGGMHDVRHAVVWPDRLTLRQREPFYHPTLMARRVVFTVLKGYCELERAERTEDLDLYFRFYRQGFKGANIDERLYFVRENFNTLKRRTIKNRINGFKTLAYGYALLGFPKRWLILPGIKTVAKSLVPVFLVQRIRQVSGKSGRSGGK